MAFQDKPSPLATKTSLEVLPALVWKNVASKIDDPVTYNSLMNTSIDLKDLMSQSRSLHLFSSCLKDIARMMTQQEFNNLRQVCSKWKASVDLLYEESPDGLGFVGEAVEGTNLSTSFQIYEFCNDMTNHTGSPFVGKRLSLQCRDDNHCTYWKSVPHLLDMFGSKVSYFHCYYYDIEEFFKCVSRMPNIRAIVFEKYETEDIEFDEEIEGYLSNHPLPSLNLLKSIKIVKDYEIPGPVLRELFQQYGGQFKKFVIFTPLYQNFCAMLTHVEIFYSRLSMLGLENLATNHVPIRDLKIDLVTNLGETDILLNLPRVFSCLEKFGLSLVLLSLAGEFVADYTESEVTWILQRRLNLPKLTHLTLKDYNAPIDPFLKCTSLRYFKYISSVPLVKWNCRSKVYFEFAECDGFHFKIKLKNTNVWELFSHLNTLAIGFRRESRMHVSNFYRCNVRV